MIDKMSQTEWVERYLISYRRIDQQKAYRFGITRLAARINDLRKRGMEIETKMETVNTRWNNGKAQVATYHYKGE